MKTLTGCLIVALAAPSGAQENGLIAYTNRAGLFVVEADGEGERRLVGDVGYARPLSWTCDGRGVLYWKHSEFGWDVWWVGLDGALPKNLTHVETGGCRMARSSPSGDFIAFMRDDPEGVWVMDSDGLNMRRLAAVGHRDNAPSWSPDGTHLVVNGAFRGSWLVSLAGGASPLELGFHDFSNATFSPSNPERLAVCGRKEKSSSSELWVVGVDGEDAIEVTPNPAEREDDPRWSPDGRRIAYSAWAPSGGGDTSAVYLRVVDVATRKVTRLPASKNTEDFSWSPDGQHLAVIRRTRGGAGQLWRIAIADGQAKRLTKADARYCAWQPRRQ